MCASQRRTRRTSALLALLGGIWLGAPAAWTAEIEASELGDAADHDLSDGICDVDAEAANVDHDDDPATPPLGQCTLRAAVQTANAEPGPDTIRLRPARYVLSLAGSSEDDAATGDLDVRSNITLAGGGFRATQIDGRRLGDRIFDVRPVGALALRHAALLSGKAPRPERDSGGTEARGDGGCLRAAGPTTASEVFFFGCTAAADGGCASATGELSLSDSVLSDCRARVEGGGLAVAAGGSATLARVTAALCKAASGGGVAARGALALTNGTFTLNRARLGGAVAVLGEGSAAIAHSTLFANRRDNLALAPGATGAITVTSSIVSGAKTDCAGAVASGGGNLESGSSCGFTGASDQQGLDPLLRPLAYDGAVPTAALDPSSPAIDRGLDAADACLDPGDARMRLRATSVAPEPETITDAGAYEFGAVASAQPSFTSAPPATATVGVAYAYDADAEDPNGACPLVFSLDEAPAGMTIAPASGAVGWTPGEAGEANVSIRATDPAGLFRLQTFVISVAPAP
jgi:hypothetical protein